MSKRFNLREFQQSVLDRLQAQVAGGGDHASTLGVQVGQEYWLVDMVDISEVLPLPPLTTVPLTKSWYCGVANVRGNLYSIVDLGVYMGGAPTPHEGQSRVLLAGQKFAFNAGLLVSRVLGLRNATEWERSEQDGEVRLKDGSGQVWRKLELAQLLQQPEFLQIGA
ncbi:MAG: chemotaxis protein CheW [Nitrosomonadales bacterium]|nr:chemotaxis protein CheW [Nitrosomonadales bacterium]